MSGHAAVNHSETYVLPDRLVIDGIEPELGIPDAGGVSVQVHSNRIERMWRDLKSYLPPGRRDEHRINEYIRKLFAQITAPLKLGINRVAWKRTWFFRLHCWDPWLLIWLGGI